MDFGERVTSVAALADPVRRSLYQYVVAQAEPVSREQAARGVGVAHHAAKFHLDKLEEDGLLDVEFHRAPGRRGPGAGRPAKHYKRSARDIEVSLPERHYDLPGELMARAISSTQTTARPVGDALSDAATAAGRELGAKARAAASPRSSTKKLIDAIGEVLTDQGYEPRIDGTTIRLANCPFHTLARNHTDLVCGMNLDLFDGLLEGAGASTLQARLDPSPGMCCVTIATRRRG